MFFSCKFSQDSLIFVSKAPKGATIYALAPGLACKCYTCPKKIAKDKRSSLFNHKKGKMFNNIEIRQDQVFVLLVSTETRVFVVGVDVTGLEVKMSVELVPIFKNLFSSS